MGSELSPLNAARRTLGKNSVSLKSSIPDQAGMPRFLQCIVIALKATQLHHGDEGRGVTLSFAEI